MCRLPDLSGLRYMLICCCRCCSLSLSWPLTVSSGRKVAEETLRNVGSRKNLGYSVGSTSAVLVELAAASAVVLSAVTNADSRKRWKTAKRTTDTRDVFDSKCMAVLCHMCAPKRKRKERYDAPLMDDSDNHEDDRDAKQQMEAEQLAEQLEECEDMGAEEDKENRPLGAVRSFPWDTKWMTVQRMAEEAERRKQQRRCL